MEIKSASSAFLAVRGGLGGGGSVQIFEGLYGCAGHNIMK